jgi:hypothetical protein
MRGQRLRAKRVGVMRQRVLRVGKLLHHARQARRAQPFLRQRLLKGAQARAQR